MRWGQRGTHEHPELASLRRVPAMSLLPEHEPDRQPWPRCASPQCLTPIRSWRARWWVALVTWFLGACPIDALPDLRLAAPRGGGEGGWAGGAKRTTSLRA